MAVLKKIKDIFHFEQYHATFKEEVFAGLTTFLTMAYAFFLVPKIFSQIGIDFPTTITATVLVATYATLFIGLFANYPFVVLPGVTLSVYIAFGLVTRLQISWQMALAMVFIAGLVLWILNLLKIRSLIIQTIPKSLRIATTAGLGLFLALIGLKNGGVLTQTADTFIFGDLTSFRLIMVAIGLISTGVLLLFRIPGAFFFGIVLIWALAAIFGKLPFEGVTSWPHPLTLSFFKLDLRSVLHFNFLGGLLSLIFVMLFDATGAVMALTHRLKRIEEKGSHCFIPKIQEIFTSDSTGTMLAGFFGTCPCSIYLESAAGIGAGGKTGLTAVVASFCFLIVLFFVPLITSIPLYATTAVLIIIGGSMLSQLAHLKWSDPTEWIPSFFTLLLIPLTFDIALGIAVGYITYCTLKLLTFKVKEVHWFSWIMALLLLVWLLKVRFH